MDKEGRNGLLKYFLYVNYEIDVFFNIFLVRKKS